MAEKNKEDIKVDIKDTNYVVDQDWIQIMREDQYQRELEDEGDYRLHS